MAAKISRAVSNAEQYLNDCHKLVDTESCPYRKRDVYRLLGEFNLSVVALAYSPTDSKTIFCIERENKIFNSQQCSDMEGERIGTLLRLIKNKSLYNLHNYLESVKGLKNNELMQSGYREIKELMEPVLMSAMTEFIKKLEVKSFAIKHI